VRPRPGCDGQSREAHFCTQPNFNTLHTCFPAARFGAQTLVTLGTSQLLKWAITRLTDCKVHQGPYAFLASSFVSFFFDIPALQRFKVVGIPLTDKVGSSVHTVKRVFGET